jgi:iron-sulfur cluster assembly protein
MSISLTEAARTRVAQFTANDPGALGLRFGVKKVGCSGWQYVVDVAKSINEQDQVFDADGVKVIVDRSSLNVVSGTEIDFRRDGLNSAFAFSNPNVTGECGCGESFSVDRAAI